MDAALRQRVLEYLRARSVMTLSTCSFDRPWAAAVFFASDGFTLYFLSSPTSRHCDHLARNGRAAAAIHEDLSDWRRIKGVQLEGVAREVTGEERAQAQRLYGEKFPLVGSLSRAPAAIIAAMAKVRWYKLVPERLYFVDNAEGFGHRDELAL